MTSPKIILHVNYVEQGQTIDEMCRKAVDWGYDGIEFRRKRAAVDEKPTDYIDEIARGMNKSGLKHVFFGCGIDLMSNDASIRRQEIDGQIDFLEMALARLPLSLCNVFCGILLNPDTNVEQSKYSRHGSSIATQTHWDQATTGMREIGSFAESHGIKLAFETHMLFLHDLPEKAVELVQMIDCPAIGVNLDYGNAIHFPDIAPLRDTIELVGPKLFYTHLKNSIGVADTRLPVSLADGEINYRSYLGHLKTSGYTGPITLEAPRSGDREWYAQSDINYIRSVLADLNWV